MKVAIMQPYFFSYVGYFQLIANTDEFVFFDTVQYNKKSWMNRNRILYPNQDKEFQYISVPIVKHNKGTLIKDVQINNNEDWRRKILGQLTVYKKLHAPYYEDVRNLILSVFNGNHKDFLSLSISSTKQICNYLNIDLKYQIASKINFDHNSVESAGDWALAISKKIGAQSYINPYGGYEIFDEEKYRRSDVGLKFLKPKLSPYKQSYRKEFISGLSIIDALMFNSKEKVRELLQKDFCILSKKELGAMA